MALPPFIHIWIFITALLVQSLYAQHIDVLAPQPVIHGEINGMKVVAQGDAVAFFAAGKPSLLLGDEECAHDLNCTMQTNRTEAVVLNPEGVWLFETPKMYAPENVTITEPLSPVSTEQFFSAGTFIKPTPIHIPLAFPQPTATPHTGNEVVDKTPGILLVSSPVREWLAETISTSGLAEEMPTRSAAETLSPIIEPSPTQQRVMLTTISQVEDELIRKLTSTATSPMPTPVPTLVENRIWGDGSIRLEVGADILTIKPSPSGQYGGNTETTSSFTFTVKQVPTSTEDGTKNTSAENRQATSTEIATSSPKETTLPDTIETTEGQNSGAGSIASQGGAEASVSDEKPKSKGDSSNPGRAEIPEELIKKYEHYKYYKREILNLLAEGHSPNGSMIKDFERYEANLVEKDRVLSIFVQRYPDKRSYSREKRRRIRHIQSQQGYCRQEDDNTRNNYIMDRDPIRFPPPPDPASDTSDNEYPPDINDDYESQEAFEREVHRRRLQVYLAPHEQSSYFAFMDNRERRKRTREEGDNHRKKMAKWRDEHPRE